MWTRSIMRKPLLGIVLLVFTGLAFAQMMKELAAIPGNVHNGAVLIAPVMAVLALFSAFYLRNRTLTVRFLIASFIFLLISSTSCIWSPYLVLSFVGASIGGGCESFDCPSICQTIALENANAVKTDVLFPPEQISLVFIGIGLVGYLHRTGKTAGAMVLEAIPHFMVVGLLIFLAYILLTFGIALFLRPLMPFSSWIATLVFIGAVVFTNNEKKPEPKMDKYAIPPAVAVLIGLALLAYAIYIMGSPGFAFQCHGLVRYADSYDYLSYCCSCP